MIVQPPLSELLESANPSIQYRLRREILGEPPDSLAMCALQQSILDEPDVRRLLGTQAGDGWLGGSFHGYDSHEAGVRWLCEKGLQPQTSGLRQALDALLQASPERLSSGLGQAGWVLDGQGLGGTYAILAAVLAQAGLEEQHVVQAQTAQALAAFEAVLDISGLEDIAERYRGQWVFKPGVRWPCIYHLRLLAFTRLWRTPTRINRLAEAWQKLVELSPFPPIYVRFKSQLIAPASFGMHDFRLASVENLPGWGWMIWFQNLELLARLGIVSGAPSLRRQVDTLLEMLESGEGWFTRPLRHAYFQHWGAYTGLMLERDWRSQRRRLYDLTFRCLLIESYARFDPYTSTFHPGD